MCSHCDGGCAEGDGAAGCAGGWVAGGGRVDLPASEFELSDELCAVCGGCDSAGGGGCRESCEFGWSRGCRWTAVCRDEFGWAAGDADGQCGRGPGTCQVDYLD